MLSVIKSQVEIDKNLVPNPLVIKERSQEDKDFYIATVLQDCFRGKFHDVLKGLAWYFIRAKSKRVSRTALAKFAKCHIDTVSSINMRLEEYGIFSIERKFKEVNTYSTEYLKSLVRVFGLAAAVFTTSASLQNLFRDNINYTSIRNVILTSKKDKDGLDNRSNDVNTGFFHKNNSKHTPGFRPYPVLSFKSVAARREKALADARQEILRTGSLDLWIDAEDQLYYNVTKRFYLDAQTAEKEKQYHERMKQQLIDSKREAELRRTKEYKIHYQEMLRKKFSLSTLPPIL